MQKHVEPYLFTGNHAYDMSEGQGQRACSLYSTPSEVLSQQETPRHGGVSRRKSRESWGASRPLSRQQASRQQSQKDNIGSTYPGGEFSTCHKLHHYCLDLVLFIKQVLLCLPFVSFASFKFAVMRLSMLAILAECPLNMHNNYYVTETLKFSNSIPQ